uniref:Uncharacterized protein n=1 Tax=Chlamydomonas leiostraca TaxID=1034604 RepID=A0A7S0RK28_9CHLO|mmetsp:Transcript_25109/g.63664  ORF Transcript_25109/g.63664 Transcript_25109/m.63664 type:complete len:773 (+) Transcript_25109:336-2654(+)
MGDMQGGGASLMGSAMSSFGEEQEEGAEDEEGSHVQHTLPDPNAPAHLQGQAMQQQLLGPAPVTADIWMLTAHGEDRQAARGVLEAALRHAFAAGPANGSQLSLGTPGTATLVPHQPTATVHLAADGDQTGSSAAGGAELRWSLTLVCRCTRCASLAAAGGAVLEADAAQPPPSCLSQLPPYTDCVVLLASGGRPSTSRTLLNAPQPLQLQLQGPGQPAMAALQLRMRLPGDVDVARAGHTLTCVLVLPGPSPPSSPVSVLSQRGSHAGDGADSASSDCSAGDARRAAAATARAAAAAEPSPGNGASSPGSLHSPAAGSPHSPPHQVVQDAEAPVLAATVLLLDPAAPNHARLVSELSGLWGRMAAELGAAEGAGVVSPHLRAHAWSEHMQLLVQDMQLALSADAPPELWQRCTTHLLHFLVRVGSMDAVLTWLLTHMAASHDLQALQAMVDSATRSVHQGAEGAGAAGTEPQPPPPGVQQESQAGEIEEPPSTQPAAPGTSLGAAEGAPASGGPAAPQSSLGVRALVRDVLLGFTGSSSAATSSTHQGSGQVQQQPSQPGAAPMSERDYLATKSSAMAGWWDVCGAPLLLLAVPVVMLATQPAWPGLEHLAAAAIKPATALCAFLLLALCRTVSPDTAARAREPLLLCAVVVPHLAAALVRGHRRPPFLPRWSFRADVVHWGVCYPLAMQARCVLRLLAPRLAVLVTSMVTQLVCWEGAGAREVAARVAAVLVLEQVVSAAAEVAWRLEARAGVLRTHTATAGAAAKNKQE